MKALFVHDHKFPKKNLQYYFSYGFDNEFFSRYLRIFDDLIILGREVSYDDSYYTETNVVDSSINFCTIKGYQELLQSDTRKNLEENFESVDALIIRLPSILGLYAISRAKKLNKPYIIELVGCPWDAYWYMGSKRKFIAPLIASATKNVLYNSKYVVYVSEKFLQSRYPTKGKSIACSNVTIHQVDDNVLNNRLEKIDRYNNDKKMILGTIGTIDSLYKGQQYVIEAISKLKTEGYNVEYHLVGGGSDKYLKRLAIELGVEDNVKFVGKLKHEEIFDWLSNIDIYVQPSDTEGLPRSVIEAMSMACPIIGSDAGGIPELINDSAIFKKGNVDDLCKIYKGLTAEKLKEQSKINHNNSKKYLKTILYNRREKFFQHFIIKEIMGDNNEDSYYNY